MASSAWERRNARARALGYRNYYDYRVHDFGRQPASAPAATGEDLARLRGHRGERDLLRYLAGEPELADFRILSTKRDDRGRITSAEIELVDDEGRIRRFRVRDLDPQSLAPALIGTGARIPTYTKRLLGMERLVEDVDPEELEELMSEYAADLEDEDVDVSFDDIPF